MNDTAYMKRTIEAAEKSLRADRLPVGAVAVFEGFLLGTEWKQGILHAHLDHAERNLQDKLMNNDDGRKNLRGVTIYTTLEPCLMCLGQMLHLRVSRVVYALSDPYGGGIRMLHPGVLPPRHEHDFPVITGGVCKEEVKVLFREYFLTTKSEFWRNPRNPLVKLCMQGA